MEFNLLVLVLLGLIWLPSGVIFIIVDKFNEKNGSSIFIKEGIFRILISIILFIVSLFIKDGNKVSFDLFVIIATLLLLNYTNRVVKKKLNGK